MNLLNNENYVALLAEITSEVEFDSTKLESEGLQEQIDLLARTGIPDCSWNDSLRSDWYMFFTTAGPDNDVTEFLTNARIYLSNFQLAASGGEVTFQPLPTNRVTFSTKGEGSL